MFSDTIVKTYLRMNSTVISMHVIHTVDNDQYGCTEQA